MPRISWHMEVEFQTSCFHLVKHWSWECALMAHCCFIWLGRWLTLFADFKKLYICIYIFIWCSSVWKVVIVFSLLFLFLIFFLGVYNEYWMAFHTLKLEPIDLCSWYGTVFNKGWCVVRMPYSCNFQMQWNLCCILQNALLWTSQWYSYGWWPLGHLRVLHFGQILLLMRKLMSVIMNYHQRFLYTSLFSILNAILIHMCLNSWFGPSVYEIGYQIKVSL